MKVRGIMTEGTRYKDKYGLIEYKVMITVGRKKFLVRIKNKTPEFLFFYVDTGALEDIETLLRVC